MSSGINNTLRDAATPNSVQRTEGTTANTRVDGQELIESIVQGVSTNREEGGGAPARKADARTAAEGRVRANNDPLVQQLMQRAQGSVKPKAFPPGTPGVPLFQTPPQGQGPLQQGQGPGGKGGVGTQAAGGKGGLFKPESQQRAKTALAGEGKLDPNHPFVQERTDQRRRFDQLGLPRTGGNRIFVNDLGADHAAAITRTIGGQTALAQGANIATEAPDRPERLQTERDTAMKEWISNKPTAGVDDLAQLHTNGLVNSVYAMAKPIREAGFDAARKNDGKKTFMNMSWGASPEDGANQMARTLLMAPEGTKLHDQAKEALGGQAPKLTVEGDRTLLDPEQVKTLKQKLIYPALDKEMATPEYKAAMTEARGMLERDVQMARNAGVMVFQSANNAYASAEAAGRPDLASSPTSDIKGLFRVGATTPNGAGTTDDTIARFSGGGRVQASAAGVDIPVGVDDKGNVRNVSGTSFASPLMTETAYVVSSVNPKLSLDQIQKVLTDPRVARDIAGTDRDGAGVVDPFAAALVARNPRITSTQIDQIRQELDKNPNAKFDLLADGTVRMR